MTAQESRAQVIEWAKQCGFASHVALLQEEDMREFIERFFSNLERFAALVAASKPVARTPLSDEEIEMIKNAAFKAWRRKEFATKADALIATTSSITQEKQG